MKTLVYAVPEKVEVRGMPVPESKEGQVRIRVSYCGICRSDTGIFVGKHPRAKAPLVLGHGSIGTIESINGRSGRFKAGDKVSPYPLLSCGHCFACKTDILHVCQTLKLIDIDVDGGTVEYMICDENVLFKIDDEVSDKAAAVIEPLAVIVHTMYQACLQIRDTTAIIGAGPIGILTGIVLKHVGTSRITISDVDETGLAICREFGSETVNVKNESMVDYVNKATDHVGVDVASECSGSEPSTLEVAKLCRIGGMVCLTGVHKVPHAANLQDVNFKEQTLVGSRVYTLREFGQTMEYTKEIAPELEKIAAHIVPLAESEEVFDLIKDPSEMTVKVLVDCRQGFIIGRKDHEDHRN